MIRAAGSRLLGRAREELQRRGVEVYLVSASSPWLIEESAKRLGVPAGRVIAMTAEVDASGRLTREVRLVAHGPSDSSPMVAMAC